MSTVKLSSGPFPGFVQLAPTTWLYRPSSENSSSLPPTTQGPDLLILSTWMGALPKHIRKYIQGYQTLFPQVPILLLTTSVRDIIFRLPNFKTQLQPAVDVIHAAASAPQNPRILLHLFSNGGAHAATLLATLYRHVHGSSLPITAMILDSAPGRGTYRRSVAALAVALPRSRLMRLVGLLVIHCLCVGMWFQHHVLRVENVVTKVRRLLLDTRLFPVQAERVYVYSREDEMVGWEDVEVAAAEAEKLGWRVERERFEGSRHVGHAVADPGRYWGIVKRAGGG